MQAVLRSFRELAPDVRHFEFEVPEAAALAYAPGQFVSMSRAIEGKHITRAYSIASAPDGNRFALCLNLVADGRFSPFLFSLEPGGAVDMKGPLGTFTLRESGRDALFVATGTGIAPFRSMLERPMPRRCKLIFGTRYEGTILYRADFERWAAERSDFDFQVTLSRPPEGWTGRSGHVQSHVLEAVGARRDFDVYVCGMKAMVDDVRAKLKELGFDRKQIIAEKYD